MCTWLNKFCLRKDVYYSDINHDIVLFDYFLLLIDSSRMVAAYL
jgi:hypothetical protein